jgi:hypothetical protein
VHVLVRVEDIGHRLLVDATPIRGVEYSILDERFGLLASVEQKALVWKGDY